MWRVAANVLIFKVFHGSVWYIFTRRFCISF